MRTFHSQNGQSLVEVLFAIALFAICVATTGYLLITAVTSLRNHSDSAQARLLATEGLEAVVSIRDEDFDLLPEGSYGLAIVDGRWTLQADSDTNGKFTRTISINDDGEDNKEVTSEVVWYVFGGVEKRLSYSTLITDWKQTKGQSGSLMFDVDEVTTNASSTVVQGLQFENLAEEDIAITQLTLQWNGAALLEQVIFDEIEVFNASTSQAVGSGVMIDIEDFPVEAGSGSHTVEGFVFTESLGTSDLLVLFTLADGSTRSVYIEL